jgi:hypothetical protein
MRYLNKTKSAKLSEMDDNVVRRHKDLLRKHMPLSLCARLDRACMQCQKVQSAKGKILFHTTAPSLRPSNRPSPTSPLPSCLIKVSARFFGNQNVSFL